MTAYKSIICLPPNGSINWVWHDLGQACCPRAHRKGPSEPNLGVPDCKGLFLISVLPEEQSFWGKGFLSLKSCDNQLPHPGIFLWPWACARFCVFVSVEFWKHLRRHGSWSLLLLSLLLCCRPCVDTSDSPKPQAWRKERPALFSFFRLAFVLPYILA